MNKSFTKFETGDEIVIDANNADSWVPVIGKPLAEAIKAAPADKTKSIIVTSVDYSTRTITCGILKEGE